jgi:hypothetical protein
MYLRTTANRLARRFVRRLARLRKVLASLPDSMRDYKAARARPAAEARSIAIHEAGHAVLLIALGLAFTVVSIIPDTRGGSLGAVYVAKSDRIADLRSYARQTLYLRYAMVYYAGAEAIRQLIPTHPRPDDGASADKRKAARYISHHIGGDAESIELLFSLAKRRCALLVEHYRPEIQALAATLEAKLVLSAQDARGVFSRSLAGRGGLPLIFKSDPTLNGLTGDTAFRAFLRA